MLMKYLNIIHYDVGCYPDIQYFDTNYKRNLDFDQKVKHKTYYVPEKNKTEKILRIYKANILKEVRLDG